MNLVAYFENLTGAGTIGAYVSLSIWGVLAVAVLSGILFGFKRGFYRSVIRTLSIALAAVASYYTAAAIGGVVYERTEGMTLVDIFDDIANALSSFYPDAGNLLSEDMRALLGSFDAEVAGQLISLVTALILIPIAFSIIFYVFKMLSWLVYWIMCAVLGLSKRRTRWLSRSLGALMGVVEGAVIAAAVLLPVAGFATVAEEIKPVLTAETVAEESKNDTEKFYADYINDINENYVIDAINTCGGDYIFKNLTRMTVNGKKAESATEEVKTVAAIYCEADVLSDFDWKAPSPEAEAALERILEIVDGDEYAATLVAGVMRGVNSAIENDTLVIIGEEPFASLVDSIFKVFDDSNKDNVADDLGTVLHVYFILGDYEVLSALEDDPEILRDVLLTKHSDGKTVIDYVVDELYVNPRTSHIVSALTEISIKVMCDMGLSEDVLEVYDNVKSGVNEILALNASDYETHEEYVNAVSENLDATLKENNIEIDEDTLNNMSNYIADNYADVSEISDEDINRAILSYYSAYADALAKGEMPEELPEGLPELQ